MSSSIEWTDETWNPTIGCTRVSSGCDHCYAVRHTQRLAGQLKVYRGLVNKGKRHFNGVVRLLHDRLNTPLSWHKPRRCFVNSMSDLFHPEVPDAFIDEVLATIAFCPAHVFQVLTKRAARMAEYSTADDLPGRVEAAMRRRAQNHPYKFSDGDRDLLKYHEALGQRPFKWPLPNLWLGTSVEDQPAADERVPALLDTAAAVRFLSCEPLLGPVDLRLHRVDGIAVDDICGDCGERHDGACEALDWIIVGGESGDGARPMNVAWARALIGQARQAGVAVFMKQLGAAAFEQDGRSRVQFRLRHTKGGDPEEWPDDLRVREYPDVA